MKKTILLLILATKLTAQPTINMWRCTDTICAGDTLRVNYKFNTPTQSVMNDNFFYIQTPYTILWQGHWTLLANKPKEHWSALAVGDSAYLIKLPTPNNLAVGNYTLKTNANAGLAFYVKNCAYTITANFNYTNLNGVVNFTSTSIGITSNTIYSWNFGNGYQLGASTVSYTYTSPSNYTVSLAVKNPKCQDTVKKIISVTINTITIDVGIEQYELNSIEPIYFDLYGNKIEKMYNCIIIEQVGLKRKKIYFNK